MGKFSAAVVGSVAIGVGTALRLPYWATSVASGTASWETEDVTKDTMKENLHKYKESDDLMEKTEGKHKK